MCTVAEVAGAQAEVQALVVRGVEAGLARHFLYFAGAWCLDGDSCANRRGGASRARQHDRQPVPPRCQIVSHQRRRLVQVDDHRVDVAVVVEIAERRSAAGVGGGHCGARSSSSSSNLPLPRLRKTTRGVRNG